MRLAWGHGITRVDQVYMDHYQSFIVRSSSCGKSELEQEINVMSLILEGTGQRNLYLISEMKKADSYKTPWTC
jgi:hypothetical protein